MSATVDAAKAGEPITKYMYGQFIEHTRDPIDRLDGADTADGRIGIVGAGGGSFHVGAASLMRAGNIKGGGE